MPNTQHALMWACMCTYKSHKKSHVAKSTLHKFDVYH